MPRPSRVRPSGRAGFRDRHGRGLRSSAAGPNLPFLQTRIDLFDDIVAQTATYLRELWPDDLDDVTFEVAGLPAAAPEGTSGPRRGDASGGPSSLERYRVDAVRRSVTLYRLPIERLTRVPESRQAENAAWQHRMVVEGYVFRAVGELLGKDPWDLAPDRYRD
ncbi:metallopeptidase family protein [Frondihabitans australicus]|uniref:Metallopeptidase family protein n=1 Tax=Frondihabitans australicus TaxID=386892 RepID=A0A495IBG2_9MICO|nr:metallopeptidase family protein [Frondihabitans australicus]RKR73262.1 hypothetical protein C8E83_0352 [Frondihabitans australicus]